MPRLVSVRAGTWKHWLTELVFLCAVTLAVPMPAEAEEPAAARDTATEPLVWQPEWRRFTWVNGAVLGASAGAIGLALLVGPDKGAPRQWILSGDEGVRDGLRPDEAGTRQVALRASDVLLVSQLAYAYLGDALINAAWYRSSPDVALQLALINTQVHAIATGVQLWTANLVSRERPYARLCETNAAGDNDCSGNYRYRSFYSNHTSTAFAMATATCTHHAHLPLYGPQPTWVPCAASMTVAAATGAARIVADQHYATDVLMGAAMGSAIGWLVPWLHYSTGNRRAEVESAERVHIAVAPLPNGFAITGVF